MGEETVNSIEEYLTLIKTSKDENLSNGNASDFLFRGQSLDYPLIPKLGRLIPKGELLKVERTIFQEFKRTNQLLIDQHRPLDDWDYLTLGQHFGLPTRLLDWSKNALTALWFASGADMVEAQELEGDSVIWILMATEADYLTDIDNVDPFAVSSTKIIQPRIIKQRINNQSGVFSIASSAEIIDRKMLNEHPNFSPKLIKVKIPKGKLQEIRYDLNTLGVNAFTIFPELEGLCAYLHWRYFKEC
jgi:hypothetical protein